jgi:RND family efflux transporter MFP subunit
MTRPPTAAIAVAALAAVALIGAAGAVGWWFHDGAGPGAPGSTRGSGAVAVETAPVQRMPLRDLRRFTGTLRAQAQFDVAPKIPGRLERLLVGLGDAVQNGQVVARLDDDEHEQQVEQARAELGVAQANLAEARSLLTVKEAQRSRMTQLHQRHIASDTELEAAQVEAVAQQARMQVARAQVTQREAALKGAEVRRAYTVIRATWSGGGATRVVGQRLADEGQQLAANQPILTIVDLSRVVAVVHAPEREYPRLRVGQAATVTAEPYPRRSFAGRIERLAPVFREASRQAQVEVEVSNPEGLLKPGMFASVEVQVGEVGEAVVVPNEAVVSREGHRGVFLADLEAQRARFVTVQTGIVEGGLTEIVEPILSGRVVTLGNHLLGDGTPIAAMDKDPGPAGAAAAESSQTPAQGSGTGRAHGTGGPGKPTRDADAGGTTRSDGSKGAS